MLQRRTILQALAPPKGARSAASKKTMAFVEKVRSQPGECRWEDMVEAFRRDYYDLVGGPAGWSWG